MSPTLAALLDGAATAKQLTAAGFDNQGGVAGLWLPARHVARRGGACVAAGPRFEAPCFKCTPPLPFPSPRAGRTSAPLADLAGWRVEQLTLSAVRDLDLYRAALTHKSALPTEERTQKVGRRRGCGRAAARLARGRRSTHNAKLSLAAWYCSVGARRM